jgi:hypothetical protein
VQQASYRCAAAYALGQDLDAAFLALKDAIDAGTRSRKLYADASAFKSLHDDSRWAELMKTLKP